MMTAAEVRAKVEASKKVAMDNFARQWGTRDVRVVAAALRRTIPTSASPADAARKARDLIG